MSSWFGVYCDALNETVLSLDTSPRLAFNDVSCVLPTSLGQLSNLQELYLSNDIDHSHVRGQLPESMTNLTSLRCLYLSHGELDGPVPAWLNNLTLLQVARALSTRPDSFLLMCTFQ